MYWDSDTPAHFIMVCDWYLYDTETQICTTLNDNQLCMNPVYAIYSSTFSTSNSSTVCDGTGLEKDFSHQLFEHKIDWIVPNKVYQSGTRTNLKVFGRDFAESGTCHFEVESGEIFTTTLIPFYDSEGVFDPTYAE